MNKEESLALFAEGRDAWNDWAKKMLDARAAIEADGIWVQSRNEPAWNDATRSWQAAAAADFSEYTFQHLADFSGLSFPGTAGFGGATFLDDALFDGARFSGDALFGGARFSGDARFTKACFSSIAWFDEASFSCDARFDRTSFFGDAWFTKASFSSDALFGMVRFASVAWFDAASFSGEAWFLQVVFEGTAVFARASFEGETTFNAVEAGSVFSIVDATFLAVPNFVQAHFAEAPRLDNCRIGPRRFSSITPARINKNVKDRLTGDPHLAASWRALKRLAIQGHDHAREQAFFKEELLARRWSEDKPWHAVFWFGLFYQTLSDFGRSLLRPILWWGVSVLCFAVLYFAQHPLFARESWPSIIRSGIGWAFGRLTGSGQEGCPLTCVAGPGDPWIAALTLSGQKGLLVSGLVPANKLNQIYACLYGIHSIDAAQPSQLTGSFSPVIPDGVTALGFIQYPLSAVLIFLFLLAIRNHFRIK